MAVVVVPPVTVRLVREAVAVLPTALGVVEAVQAALLAAPLPAVLTLAPVLLVPVVLEPQEWVLALMVRLLHRTHRSTREAVAAVEAAGVECSPVQEQPKAVTLIRLL